MEARIEADELPVGGVAFAPKQRRRELEGICGSQGVNGEQSLGVQARVVGRKDLHPVFEEDYEDLHGVIEASLTQDVLPEPSG